MMETKNLFTNKKMGTKTTVKSGVSAERPKRSRFNLLLFGFLAVALSMSFSSCSKDKEEIVIPENSDKYSYIEVVIDGQKYTYNAINSYNKGNVNNKFYRFSLMGLGESKIKTSDFNISFDLIVYQNPRDLESAKTGNYQITTIPFIYDNYNPKLFDLEATISCNDECDAYEYVSGKHNIYKAKRLSVDSKKTEFLIESTFSGIFKHRESGKTMEISEGKYWTKFSLFN